MLNQLHSIKSQNVPHKTKTTIYQTTKHYVELAAWNKALTSTCTPFIDAKLGRK